MNTNPSTEGHAPASGRGGSEQRALVLAGAGAAGNAWEIGLVAGLFEAGVDLTAADLIVGTSAGSTVAAQITSGTKPARLYAAILGEGAPPRARGAGGPGSASLSGPSYLEWSNGIIASSHDAADMRRRLGKAALEREEGAAATRWRDTVAARLPGARWPGGRLLIPAVDAETGEPVVFDRDSGVDLVDAVAASTSAMTPYRIGDRRYLNGGYRRSENADLAAGYGRVVVLSPFGGRSRMPLAWRMDLASQMDELRAGGSTVEAVFPAAAVGAVFDANALDPATRGPAARGGFDQGRDLAPRLASWWGDPPERR